MSPLPCNPTSAMNSCGSTTRVMLSVAKSRWGVKCPIQRLAAPAPGDIVVSNISAVYRAICVVSKDLDHLLVSNEFTVMRLKPTVDAGPLYIWSVLRSTAVIAEWLSGASGVGRTRVDWQILKNQRIPLLAGPRQREIGEMYRIAEDHARQVLALRERAESALLPLNLESGAAKDRIQRAKPPR